MTQNIHPPAVAPGIATMRLGMVLQLARRARRAEPDELPFIFTNETRQLIPYRQAVLWTSPPGGVTKIKALSGLAAVDYNSPYAVWMNWFGKHTVAGMFISSAPRDDDVRLFSLAELEKHNDAASRFGEWREWTPEHTLAAVLRGPGGWVCGYLCLFRETSFHESDVRLFSHLAESYGTSLGGRLMRPQRAFFSTGFRRIAALAATVLFFLAMCIPRPQSTLAQAEVTARRPALVRAELDGVVEKFMVEPNQQVRKGEALLKLEDAQLKTRLAVAEKAGEIAQVELRQLQQAALYDPASKAKLPLAQGRVEQLFAEAEYVRSLLDRVVALSPMDGAALIDNPDEWLGRPVGLGQKIMMVADPSDVMLEIRVPAADALPAAPGDVLLFFPNIAPSSPLKATIVFAGYRAVETPGAGMAFLLRAEFADTEQRPMLGLRGTARLSASSLPLGLIILRRPITAARQWLGL